MMVRREVIDQLGGFDERLFIYGDEVDWCHRMAQAGWTVNFVAEAEVIHLGGQAMNRVADRRNRLLIEGNVHFYRVHHPKWKEAALRGIIALTALVRIGGLCVVALLERTGLTASDRVWQLISREHMRVGAGVMLRQWVAIFRDCLRGSSGDRGVL